MAEIGIKELKATASAVIERVEGGTAFVVTKRGRPAAVLLPVEDAEDLVLANTDEYLKMRREGRASYAQGSTHEPQRARLTSYRVELAPSAVRVFTKLPSEVRSRLRQALDKLARDASKPGRIGGKAVKSIKGTDDAFHRLRVGDYRVMYDVIDGDRVILVLGIVHRGDLERWIRSR